jgi:HK97 family phage prohead protease
LWQHDAKQPIGTAKIDRPTKDGITFEARIPRVSEPGKLKDRLDEVWQSLKAGLVRGASIGFKANEMSFLKEGGIHFLETTVLELSLVTIPANAQATIDEIKAFDTGQMNGGATQPGATQPNKRKVAVMPMTTAEQISAYEAKRAASVARMDELMKKSAEAQQTLDDAESQEYDDAAADIKKIDVHLKRLADLETINKAAAKPVSGNNLTIGSESRSVTRSSIISVKANVPPEMPFIRYCMAMCGAKGNRLAARERARKHWHDQTPEVELMLSDDIPELMTDPMISKAAIGVGTTTDATWASPLIAYTQAAQAYIEYLRPMTILGKFGTNGIPSLRRVPFNIQMPRATAGSTMGWVGELAPKPVSNLQFETVTMRWAKAAGIVVLTAELVKFSNPSAEAIVREDMTASMAQFLDRQFIDPTVAAVTNVSPASITNGATSINRTGTNQAAWVTDANTLLSGFLTNNLSTVGGVWIMSQRQALAFSLMLNSLGQPYYPNISATGGTLMGYPVIASENVPSVGGSPSDGTPIIFAIAPEIMLADDGQVMIDASDQASLEMNSSPESPPTASTAYVSMFQLNAVALRAEIWINWLKRRSTAVAYIANANYA